ncbi:MAG: HAD family hydrolase [Bacteroidales bacterium]
MIKNIIFDLGGVIVGLDKQNCIDSFSAIGFNDFGRIINEYVQDGFFLDFEKGKIGSDEFRENIRKDINGIVSDEQIDSAMAAFLPGIPKERLDAIYSYRKRYRVFLLSNTNPIAINIVRPMFEISGRKMEDYFEKMFLSYEMKLAKPDEEIFRKVLTDTGISPDETLFVDDSKANLDTAEKLGIKTVLITQQHNLTEDLRPSLC